MRELTVVQAFMLCEPFDTCSLDMEFRLRSQVFSGYCIKSLFPFKSVFFTSQAVRRKLRELGHRELPWDEIIVLKEEIVQQVFLGEYTAPRWYAIGASPTPSLTFIDPDVWFFKDTCTVSKILDSLREKDDCYLSLDQGPVIHTSVDSPTTLSRAEISSTVSINSGFLTMITDSPAQKLALSNTILDLHFRNKNIPDDQRMESLEILDGVEPVFFFKRRHIEHKVILDVNSIHACAAMFPIGAYKRLHLDPIDFSEKAIRRREEVYSRVLPKITKFPVEFKEFENRLVREYSSLYYNHKEPLV